MLLAVGREAADLQRDALALQDGLSSWLRVSGTGNTARIELQALDLLSQRLRGLADFLGALAPTLPGDWRCNAQAAAALVTVSDLRNRLCVPEDGQRAPAVEAGACELFQACDEPSALHR